MKILLYFPIHSTLSRINSCFFNYIDQLRPILDEDTMNILSTKIMNLGLGQIQNFEWCRKVSEFSISKNENWKLCRYVLMSMLFHYVV